MAKRRRKSFSVLLALGMFITRKVLGKLAEVSRDSTKPTKMIAEQENNFWKDCEKRYSSVKSLMDTFE